MKITEKVATFLNMIKKIAFYLKTVLMEVNNLLLWMNYYLLKIVHNIYNFHQLSPARDHQTIEIARLIEGKMMEVNN